MSIISCLTTSFKKELLSATHNMSSDVLKVSLYSPSAQLGPQTAVYSATNEIVDAGYTAGGKTLINVQITQDNTSIIVDFDNPYWTFVSTVPLGGAMIYNSSKSNKAVMVLSFGMGFSKSGQFVMTIPEPTATSGLIRIS